MRIAYVCADPGIPVHGRKGASVHVAEVVRALRRDGHDVEVFATRVADEPAPDDLRDLVVHGLDRVDRGDPGLRELALLAANEGLRQCLERTGPFDLVYERHALMSHATGGYARAHGIPLVIEVNAPLVDEQARHRVLVHRDLAETSTRELFAAATSLVAVSEPVADWVRARTPSPERVHVVPNGVDPTRFPLRQPRGPSTTPVVGFLGTLKPWHGVEALVDAMARVRETTSCRLVVVGDGPEHGRLVGRVAARGLASATTFTGSVAPSSVPSELARMDVGTAPYTDVADDYFSPMKIFEYQAAGLPVVASAVGQVPEIVHDGHTGVLCRPGDVEALAGALSDLVRHPEQWARMGDAGRRWVTRHRTWDVVVERVLATARVASPHAEPVGRS